jgi:hypothetical protein
MTTPWCLQTVLYDIIKDSPKLQEICPHIKLHDLNHHKIAYPSIVVGKLKIQDWSSHTHDGSKIKLPISTYVASESIRDIYAISYEVKELIYTKMRQKMPAIKRIKMEFGELEKVKSYNICQFTMYFIFYVKEK